MAKRRLRTYKVTAVGPESTVVFFVYRAPTKRAVFLRIKRDEARRSILRKERIYAVDLKSMKIEVAP